MDNLCWNQVPSTAKFVLKLGSKFLSNRIDWRKTHDDNIFGSHSHKVETSWKVLIDFCCDLQTIFGSKWCSIEAFWIVLDRDDPIEETFKSIQRAQILSPITPSLDINCTNRADTSILGGPLTDFWEILLVFAVIDISMHIQRALILNINKLGCTRNAKCIMVFLKRDEITKF